MEFCKKKQKNVTEKFFSNFEHGDAYTYLCIKRKTGLFLAHTVGKWVQHVCDDFYDLIASRTQWPTYKNKISFCTDGNDQNLNAMLKVFNKDCIDYGMVVKDKVKQKVIGSHSRKILGKIAHNEIYINNIDGLCAALRERISCFTRKGKTFSKKRKTIEELVGIYQAYHNLIKIKNGETPCMKEGLTNQVWTWGKLLNKKISVVN